MPRKPAQDALPLAAPRESATGLLERTLDLLACPACLRPLRMEPATLACLGCGRIYPVVDGIPILLADQAVLPA